jgi:SNF2 family DNA or RNA helicase
MSRSDTSSNDDEYVDEVEDNNKDAAEISDDEEEHADAKQQFISTLRQTLSAIPKQLQTLNDLKAPPELQATLFDFQLEGLRWLQALYSCHLNGILGTLALYIIAIFLIIMKADEMGTG